MVKKLFLWILIPAVILLPTAFWHFQTESRILEFIYTNTPGLAVGLWYGLLIRRQTTKK
jgi:hypothetical protein